MFSGPNREKNYFSTLVDDLTQFLYPRAALGRPLGKKLGRFIPSGLKNTIARTYWIVDYLLYLETGITTGSCWQ